MKYAICNELFESWPMEKAFHFARQCGYTGIEIAPFTIDTNAAQISAAQRREIVRLAADADLQVVGLHWLLAKTEGFYLTSPEAAVRQRTAQYLATLARLCADLREGAPGGGDGGVMVLGSPKQRNLLPGVTLGEAIEFGRQTIAECLPVLEETGVVLALEPLGPSDGDFWTTADDVADTVAHFGSPHVQLHLDVKAMSSESTPIADIIRRHAPHTAHFHANDPNLLGPGMGEVDFTPIFAALRETNYRGWVSVEVFDFSPGIERIAKESIRNMEAL